MATWLRQSTAIDIPIGPFVDQTDGFTAETGLTLAQADIRLKKNAGAWAQKNQSSSATHEENGWYEASLDTTDTNTLGILIVAVNESGALPVWHEFLVLPANVYDALISGSGVGVRADVQGWLGTAPATPTVNGVPEVDITHLGGAAQSATDLKDFADDGYDPATNKVQGVVLVDTLTTYTGNTPQTGDSFARIGATGSGLTSLASQASVNVIDDFLDTEIAAILAAVDTEIASIISTLGTPAGASVSADIAAIEAQTDDIGAAGAGLTAVPWNAAWDAEVQSEVDDALIAQRLDELLNADSDIDGAAPPTVGSVFHEVLSKTAGSFTYDQTTDSLEAIRDKETDIETDTQDIQGRLPAALVGGRIDAHVGSMAAAVIAAATFAASAIDNNAIATGAISSGKIAAGAITAGKFAAGAIDAAAIGTDAIDADALAANAVAEIQAGLATSAAIAAIQADTDDIQTRLPAALVGGRIDSSVGAMAAGVVTAAAVATGAVDADALSTDAAEEIADAILGRNLAGGSNGGRDIRSALRVLRNRRAIAAGTLTVRQEDDVAVAWTAAVTTAAGNPITDVDPA